MTTALQDLTDRRSSAWAQAQDFLARNTAGDDLSAEDNAAWARALEDVDAIGAQITNITRSTELEARFAAIDEDTVVRNGDGSAGGFRDEYRTAFEAYCRFGMTGLNGEQRALLEQNMADATRDQGVATGAAGGFTVPQGFWAKVTETLKLYVPVVAISENLITDAGNPLPWPTNDDTGNIGELLAENTAATALDVTFGQKQLGTYMYSSKIIKVSRQLMQDSGIDIEAFLAKKIGQRLGRITNQHFTTGTGTSQPQGFITGATTGVTGPTGNTLTVPYDSLVDLVHSVDAAYRNAGACQFVMHDLSLAVIRKIKDSQNRPLWQPAIAAGMPDTLLGYPVSVNNFVATMAANAKSIAFGDFGSAYVTRSVSGGSVLRLDERYAEALQVAFLGFGRYDALTQDASAVKLYVNSAT